MSNATTVRSTSEHPGMTAIGIVVATIAMMATSAITYAFTVAKLWSWFVVPTFHLAPITLPVATGLMLLCRATNPPVWTKTEPEELSTVLGRGIAWPLLVCAFALGYGAIARSFM